MLLTSGKPLALLTFLHCTPGRTASREQLLELLWSDAEAESGRHTLRQTLWYIRRKVGMDPFASSGDGVRLALEISSDRDAFLRALDADDPQSAIQSYNGDFFTDFAAPGGADFEHWADLERSRLRALYLGAATRVVRDRLGRGRARDSIAVARRAIEIAPRHQAAWRLVLESCLAADDAVSATLEAERLQAWMIAEEVDADAATLALLKTIRAGTRLVEPRTPNETASLQTELVGRESEFADLLAALEIAKRGQPRHVHISAPAGHGKSRLLDGFAARLRSNRVRVVTVRGTPAERSLPYAFAAHLVTALVPLRGAAAVSPDSARALVALAPAASNYLRAEADRSTGDDALRRRSLALTELVTTLAHDAPLVMLIDDVHWIDPQSRVLLASLSTRLATAPVLLVTAARPADRFVDETPGAQRMALSPLSVDDVGALVMSVGQLPSEPWSDALIAGLHATSDGSPLLVLETLQLVIERGQLQLVDQTWLSPDPSALVATLTAGRAMQQRIDALSAAARDSLLRLAIAGTFVESAALPILLPQDGREALSDLETRGLVTRIEEAWRVAHDEIATLTIEMSSMSDRARANQAAADYLEQTTSGDLTRLVRAGFHRARANDSAALDRVFVRAVRAATLTGDSSAMRNMGREMLGPDAAREDVDRLVARLPWSVRHHASRWWGGAMVLATVAIVALLMTARPSATPSHDLITATMLPVGDASGGFGELRLTVQDLARDEPIDLIDVPDPFPREVLSRASVDGRLADKSFIGAAVLSKDKREGMELVRILPNGTVSRLLHADDDQAGVAVSPDGLSFVYSTGEWHDSQQNELAIMRGEGKVPERLTHSSTSESGARWSPDGSRVAYVRSFDTPHPSEVCWISIDGRVERCRALNRRFIPTAVISWRGDQALLIIAQKTPDLQPTLLSFDLQNDSLTAIDSSGSSYVADPEGDAVICLCRARDYPSAVLTVFSPSSPNNKRVLRAGRQPIRSIVANFISWQRTVPFLDSIKIDGTTRAAADQRLQFRVRGFDRERRERAVPAVQWSSLDTIVATIDSTGNVLTRREGVARVVASAGGWRQDTILVSVGASDYRLGFTENWSQPFDGTWTRYGDPTPTVTQSGGRNVLRVNGDTYLMSGVVSRKTLDASKGVGVRILARLPVNVAKWQVLHLALDYVASDDAISAWTDRAVGLPPKAWNATRESRMCEMGAPRQEGGAFIDLISLIVSQSQVAFPRDPTPITDGKWHSISLQVLGDGRCALAIDSSVVAVSSNSILLDRRLRVLIEGQSEKTTVEVGAVEAWTGVRSDIDWTGRPPPRVGGAANTRVRRP